MVLWLFNLVQGFGHQTPNYLPISPHIDTFSMSEFKIQLGSSTQRIFFSRLYSIMPNITFSEYFPRPPLSEINMPMLYR